MIKSTCELFIEILYFYNHITREFSDGKLSSVIWGAYRSLAAQPDLTCSNFQMKLIFFSLNWWYVPKSIFDKQMHESYKSNHKHM